MRISLAVALTFLVLPLTSPANNQQNATEIAVRLRKQSETEQGSERFHRVEQPATWDGSKTALIICDMWDSHHCYRAVLREQEFAPRLNQVAEHLRDRGVTIIHAPSDCMAAYADHPSRARAKLVPEASNYPDNIDEWCHKIPSEEQSVYPIDQSDGGEDDTPAEHAAWEAKLLQQGRNPQAPWKQQIESIEIDSNKDYVSDSGKEIWNILQHRRIENVMIAGVHANMCVLGRPFGLRRMALAGKNVALIRDLTDTMYNPAAWPFVSHHSGTDLIVSHVERFVCPTISSDQIIGGESFRYKDDSRAHLAIIINEPEYETERTLPLFVREDLQQDHRISMIFGSAQNPNEFPGIELISEADALLLSVRRRTPPPQQLEAVRDYVATGKPVLGIRTASHAFCLRGASAPAGTADWPEFDAEVFGGSYTNHYGNDLKNIVSLSPKAASHEILTGISAEPFVAGGSLYKVSPVASNAAILMFGRVEGHNAEPVAWTWQRTDGGRSFYTSLGSPADFEHPTFRTLLKNAIKWSTKH